MTFLRFCLLNLNTDKTSCFPFPLWWTCFLLHWNENKSSLTLQLQRHNTSLKLNGLLSKSLWHPVPVDSRQLTAPRYHAHDCFFFCEGVRVCWFNFVCILQVRNLSTVPLHCCLQKCAISLSAGGSLIKTKVKLATASVFGTRLPRDIACRKALTPYLALRKSSIFIQTYWP